MKTAFLLIAFFMAQLLTAQVVLNGSFEDNSFQFLEGNNCDFNNDCNTYHLYMAHSNAWDAVPNWDGDYHDCFVGVILEGCTYQQIPWGPTPVDGDVALKIYGAHRQTPFGGYIHIANAISLSLSAPLEVGSLYSLSYYVRESPECPIIDYDCYYNPITLSVGISEKDTAFGELIHTSIMPDSVWRLQSLTFEASIPAQHLTFKVNTPSPQTEELLHYVIMLDNVVLSGGVSLAEAAKPSLQLYPNPTTGYVRLESRASSLALYDMLGREHYRSEMNVSHHLFIQDLPQGVYTVKTFDEQGKLLESEKLIKSK